MTTRMIAGITVLLCACGEDERVLTHEQPLIPTFEYVDSEGAALGTEVPGETLVEKIVADERVPVVAPDGHALDWAEFGRATGTARVSCEDGGTRIALAMEGLIPAGLYTGWLVFFEAPGFAAGGLEALAGLSPMGPFDGSLSGFTADAEGRGTLEVVTPAGPLGLTFKDDAEPAPRCLLDAYEVMIEVEYHIDGMTYGTFPGNDDVVADHLAWAIADGAVESL